MNADQYLESHPRRDSALDRCLDDMICPIASRVAHDNAGDRLAFETRQPDYETN